jgi:hypothetical protein
LESARKGLPAGIDISLSVNSQSVQTCESVAQRTNDAGVPGKDFSYCQDRFPADAPNRRQYGPLWGHEEPFNLLAVERSA